MCDMDTNKETKKSLTSIRAKEKAQEEAEIKLVTEDPSKITKIANPSFAVQQAAIDAFTRRWWKMR